MHPQILTISQIKILPLIKLFSRSYFLVGGTAIALQIGHRRSIDFDLFRNGTIDHKKIADILRKKRMKYELIFKNEDGYHCRIEEVKLTFFSFPNSMAHPVKFDGYISMPGLLDLGAMKAFAFSRRGKWKDYVDMYFLLRDHYSFREIATRAEELFSPEFSSKLFRTQLSYFGDIDYSETIEYVTTAPTDREIKSFLSKAATEPF